MSIDQPNNVPVAERLYRLAQEYIYAWEKQTRTEKATAAARIVVPVGFLYDGASVPRVAWTLSGVLPDGLIRAAALVHDWLYRYKGRLPAGSYQYRDQAGNWQDYYAAWSRKDADRLFGRMMREAGMSKRRRRLAYRTVRWFGWWVWKK
jgi:hypothetical protein